MPRPIEAVVESRQELVALSATFEQAGWEAKIKSSFPRWRNRAEQRLAQFVSVKVSTEFAGLTRKRRAAQSESWTDVVARHLSFLEVLVSDVQAHPEEYGPSVIARERTVATAARDRERTTPTRVPAAEPKRVTLAWLARHLSLHLVAFYVVSILAAFALGVGVARVAGTTRSVGAADGIIADTVVHPPATPP